MKLTHITTLRTAAAVGLAAAATLAGGTAVAQLPGAGNGGVVVRIDSDLVTVTVNDKGESPTRVTGTIRNTSPTTAMRCATPGQDGAEYPGQVTEAEIVARSMVHYGNSIFSPIGGGGAGVGGLDLGSLAPGLDIGSVTGILPSAGEGPLGSLMGEPSIADAQALARDLGRTGDPLVSGNAAFTLQPGQTRNWAAALARPITQDGERGEWQAAAMFFCSSTGDPTLHYVFAGYEGSDYAAIPEGSLGSSGSGSGGSLQS